MASLLAPAGPEEGEEALLAGRGPPAVPHCGDLTLPPTEPLRWGQDSRPSHTAQNDQVSGPNGRSSCMCHRQQLPRSSPQGKVRR